MPSVSRESGIFYPPPGTAPDLARPNAPIAAGEIVPDELLTRRPRIVRVNNLNTPELRQIPASGRLILELTVRKTGLVSNVLVVHNELPGPYLAHAMNAFTYASYAPGEMAGAVVDSKLRVEVAVSEGGPAVVGGHEPPIGAAQPRFLIAPPPIMVRP